MRKISDIGKSEYDIVDIIDHTMALNTRRFLIYPECNYSWIDLKSEEVASVQQIIDLYTEMSWYIEADETDFAYIENEQLRKRAGPVPMRIDYIM